MNVCCNCKHAVINDDDFMLACNVDEKLKKVDPMDTCHKHDGVKLVSVKPKVDKLDQVIELLKENNTQLKNVVSAIKNMR